MNWIYLSPHLDDAVLSCGGLIWEQTQAGRKVSVWTICAGDPPDDQLSSFAELLHARWNTGPLATQLRRKEDIAACKLVGAETHHFLTPDCIYRRLEPDGPYIYTAEESLFGPLASAEESLVETLADELAQNLPQAVELVCPLALGGHVDHRLTRLAAERLGRPLWYYADYPYSNRLEAVGQVAAMRLEGWSSVVHSVSNAGFQAWEQAIAAHASQVGTFWPDLDTMRAELRAYYDREEGLHLWRAPLDAAL